MSPGVRRRRRRNRERVAGVAAGLTVSNGGDVTVQDA
jgi:phage shock protein PspC (stress-responsive transcriptional regulator)